MPWQHHRYACRNRQQEQYQETDLCHSPETAKPYQAAFAGVHIDRREEPYWQAPLEPQIAGLRYSRSLIVRPYHLPKTYKAQPC